MGNQSLSALTLTPRQAFEVARLLDRTGDGIVYGDAGIVTVLLDLYGTGSPNLALELDGEGEVIARQVLSLHRCDVDDGAEDFGEEEPLPPPVDVRDARPAKRCECDEPFGDEDVCLRCGRSLPVEAPPEDLQRAKELGRTLGYGLEHSSVKDF
jgi:hypothetical protein